MLDVVARWAPEAASRAREALAGPWRVAVVARVGAGKSTLVNRITGAALPTGLGGVTREPCAIAHGAVELVDTPGIDGEDAAIAALGPIVGDCDAILWVVDGLQPATRTERAVLDALRPPGQPIAAVIARLDLVDSDDVDAVRQRVAQVLGGVAPAGGDLRAWSAGLPDDVAPRPTSPRRERAVRDAVRDALDAARAAPVPEDRDAIGQRLATSWRDEVRQTVLEVVAGIDDETIPADGTEGLALVAAGRARIADFCDRLSRDAAVGDAIARVGAPPIPPVGVEPPRTRDLVAAALGGRHRATTHVRAAGARWLGDGLIALSTWVAAAPDLDLARRSHMADLDHLAAAIEPPA